MISTDYLRMIATAVLLNRRITYVTINRKLETLNKLNISVYSLFLVKLRNKFKFY